MSLTCMHAMRTFSLVPLREEQREPLAWLPTEMVDHATFSATKISE